MEDDKVEIIDKLVDFNENEDVAEFRLQVETKQAILKVASAISNFKLPEDKEVSLEETNTILKSIASELNKPCEISVTLTLK
jgi:hypothetical protein